jgi:hypothetical protein
MNAKCLLLIMLSVSAVVPAQAQSSNVVVTGTVDRIDATAISVKNTASDAVEDFKLAPKVLVVQNKPATLADIKPNDFVASAAVRDADGRLHSTELRIFPDTMRGVGEGQRPMNDVRNQTMTNATVTGAAVVNGSNDIKVRFQGGESELIVDPGVPVTRIDAADISLVKHGVKVQLRGVRTEDGASINRIAIQ